MSGYCCNISTRAGAGPLQIRDDHLQSHPAETLYLLFCQKIQLDSYKLRYIYRRNPSDGAYWRGAQQELQLTYLLISTPSLVLTLKVHFSTLLSMFLVHLTRLNSQRRDNVLYTTAKFDVNNAYTYLPLLHPSSIDRGCNRNSIRYHYRLNLTSWAILGYHAWIETTSISLSQCVHWLLILKSC
jgi:hypothetical protein